MYIYSFKQMIISRIVMFSSSCFCFNHRSWRKAQQLRSLPSLLQGVQTHLCQVSIVFGCMYEYNQNCPKKFVKSIYFWYLSSFAAVLTHLINKYIFFILMVYFCSLHKIKISQISKYKPQNRILQSWLLYCLNILIYILSYFRFYISFEILRMY